LLGLCILTLFFSYLNIYNVPIDLSLIILLILIWFCLAAILKLRELEILIKKFTSEHYSIMRHLMKHLRRTLSVFAAGLLGVLTVGFQVFGANIVIFYSCLLLLIVITQALVWYLILNNIISRGSLLFYFWILLLVFFPVTLVITEIISQFPLLVGTSRVLNFAIVMGGSCISLCLFYNFMGHLSWMTPQEIKSNQDLKIKFSKLREIRGECFHLLPEMHARKIIPVDAEIKPLITLSGPSKFYISVEKNKQTKFFDMEKKIEVTDKLLTQQFKMTLRLKDAVKTMTLSKIKKRWLLFKNFIIKFLIYPRLAPHLEKGGEASRQVSQLPISRRLKIKDKEMTQSDFEIMFKLMYDFRPRIRRITMMLSILNEIASVDIAT